MRSCRRSSWYIVVHEVSTSKLDALGTSIDLLSADLTLERLTRVWSAMRTGSQRARLSRLQVESLEDHATFAGSLLPGFLGKRQAEGQEEGQGPGDGQKDKQKDM